MKQRWKWLWAVVLLSLCGCSSLDRFLEEQAVAQSGIRDSDVYQEYQSLSEGGQLDRDGYYFPEEAPEESELPPANAIRITFARNPYLDIQYYQDEALTLPLDGSGCYVYPGDSIYAAEAVNTSPYRRVYSLSAFVVYEYGADGAQGRELSRTPAGERLVFQIPADYRGKELAIMPLGAYASRFLSLEAYATDDAGARQLLAGAGIWTVNGEVKKDTAVQVSSVEPYTVRFAYDSQQYFYVGSSPACFYADNQGGVVEFREADAADETETYTVELHPYLTLSVLLEKEGTVSINGEETVTLKKGDAWSSQRLAFGDRIVIQTNGGGAITGGDYAHIRAARDTINGGYRYTLDVVPESDPQAADTLAAYLPVREPFRITLSTDDLHGTCVYQRGLDVLSGTVEVRAGDRLTLMYTLTDEQYTYAEPPKELAGIVYAWLYPASRMVTITVTADMANTEIRREQYIKILKKETSVP